MKLALLVYLANISHGVSAILGFFALLTFSFVLMAGLFVLISVKDFEFLNKKHKSYSWESEDEIKEHNEQVPKNRKLFKRLMISLSIVCFLSGLISILIPSEKTIYIMAGAYAIEQIATNDRVQKIGSDVLEVIENKLEKLKEDK